MIVPQAWCNSVLAVVISGGFGRFAQAAATDGRLGEREVDNLY